NVAIFAIVHSVLLRPLPVPDSENIVLMSNRYPKAGVGEQFISSLGDYFDRRERVTALTEQAAFRFANETIYIGGTGQRDTTMIGTTSAACSQEQRFNRCRRKLMRSMPPIWRSSPSSKRF